MIPTGYALVGRQVPDGLGEVDHVTWHHGQVKRRRSLRGRMGAVVLVMALAACGGSRDPRATATALFDAIAGGQVEAAAARLVSPAQLEALVACADDRAPWLTAADRRADVERFRRRAAAAAGEVRLRDFVRRPDYVDQWKRYQPGDVVHGACKARRAFAVEVYYITIATGPERQSHKPLELWGWDGDWFVWDDPLDTEGFGE